MAMSQHWRLEERGWMGSACLVLRVLRRVRHIWCKFDYSRSATVPSVLLMPNRVLQTPFLLTSELKGGNMIFVLSQVHSSSFHTFAPWPSNLLQHLTLLYHIDKTADTWFTTAEPNVSASFCYLSISNTVAYVLYINQINRLKFQLSTSQLQLCEMIFLITFTCADRPCFLNYKCQTVNLKMRQMDGRHSPPYLTACKWEDKKQSILKA